MRTQSRVVLWAAATLVVAGCGGDGDGAPVTYYQHLKPVIDAKCAGCHNPEGIAPFSLTSFEEISEQRAMALLMVEERKMPPWPPNGECNDYLGDRSLSDEQIALFRRWVDGGALAGDPAQPAPALQVEQLKLSRVDLSLSMATDYTPQVANGAHDDYRCFVIPWTESATKYVTGFRAVPGNPKIVHHVIAFHASAAQVPTYEDLDAADPDPGYECFGASGGPAQSWLGAWAPGSLGSDMPAGTGLPVEPGDAVILQVHYNLLATGPEPDRTRIELKLDDTVAKPARIQPWANPSWLDSQVMRIPAGDPDVMHEFEFDATFVTDGPFDVHAAGLHMHTLGTRATASIVHIDGPPTCLLQIDDWDFHWQGSYSLRTPEPFNAGDRLRVECHWDNSAANQPLVDGQPRQPIDVYWGEGTTDEMCLGAFYITPR